MEEPTETKLTKEENQFRREEEESPPKSELNFNFSKWGIKIPEWKDLYNKANNEEYTVYLIIVSNDKFEWVLWKRFQEFLELHQQLEKKYDNLPPFPPRRPKILIDNDFLNERRKVLAAYFNGLKDELFEESEELKAFLDIYSGEKRMRPIPDGVSLMLPKDLLELQQAILAETQSLPLSNSRPAYLPSIFDTTRAYLLEMDDLKRQLDSIYGTQVRIEFLNHTSETRRALISELEEQQAILTSLTDDLEVKGQVTEDVFLSMLRSIELALSWAHNIENSVYQELNQQCSVWDRIKEYRTEVEAKVTLLMQVGPDEQKKLVAELQTIEEKIKRDLQFSQKDPEAHTNLESLLHYIHSGSHSSFFQNKQGKGRVTHFESEIYKLLEKINKLNNDSSDEEYHMVKQNLTTLTREIGAFRVAMEKEISLGENVLENKSCVDHLEDLQENLADIVFTFSTKFDSFSQVGVVLSKKVVAAAQSRHGKTENKLFEL